ncbi:MAG: hypothetical protein ABIG68_10735 [Acidobacteriota bacterium]
MKNKTLLMIAAGAGGYMIWKWYQKDKAKRVAALATQTPVIAEQSMTAGGDIPRTNSADLSGLGEPVTRPAPWRGYGKVQANISQAKAWGAQTAETCPAMNPTPPNLVAADDGGVPEGEAFIDDNEFNSDSEF